MLAEKAGSFDATTAKFGFSAFLLAENYAKSTEGRTKIGEETAKLSRNVPTSINWKSLGTTKPSTPCQKAWGQISLMLFTRDN